MFFPKFNKFIDSLPVSMARFAKQAKVSPKTLYLLYSGKRESIHRFTANRIILASKGRLKLVDLGIDE